MKGFAAVIQAASDGPEFLKCKTSAEDRGPPGRNYSSSAALLPHMQPVCGGSGSCPVTVEIIAYLQKPRRPGLRSPGRPVQAIAR